MTPTRALAEALASAYGELEYFKCGSKMRGETPECVKIYNRYMRNAAAMIYRLRRRGFDVVKMETRK